MDHDKLRRILGLDIMNKINAPYNALKGMTDLGRLIQLNDPLRHLNLKALNPLPSFVTNGLYKDISSMMSNPAHRQLNQLDYIINPTRNISSMLNAISDYDRSSAAINKAILGGSTISSFATNIPKLNKDVTKSLAVISSMTAMQDAVTKNLSAYTKQVQLSEQIARAFTSVFPVKNSAFDFFNTTNFSANKKLNAFDYLSGSTFLDTFINNDEDEDKINETYSNIEELLKEENSALKEYIIKLQATIIALKKGKKLSKKDEKWVRLKGIEYYAEWFMNKVLIRKFNLRAEAARIIMYLVLLTLPFIKDVFIEANGDLIYNAALGSDEKIAPDTILKYVQMPQEMKDFTIKETAVYRRGSVRTDRIGKFKSGTDLLIIKITTGWCFVEGTAIVKKKSTSNNKNKYKIKKGVIEIEQKVKGWVKKDALDMFQ